MTHIKYLSAYSLPDKMQSPVTKGVLITVGALVAAGIAVYESPQFRQWMDNSRRKLAQTLHHLGDEIQPQPQSQPGTRSEQQPMAQDISMTEDTSDAAEERRRAVREELERRSAALVARRRKSTGSPASSFDGIVDKQGRLLDLDGVEVDVDVDTAGSTGVDLGLSQVVQRGDREKMDSSGPNTPGTPGTPHLTPSGRESPAASSQTGTLSFADLGSRASTPSALSDFSHVPADGDAQSGTATPAGWSEVGSEISNDDINDYHY